MINSCNAILHRHNGKNFQYGSIFDTRWGGHSMLTGYDVCPFLSLSHSPLSLLTGPYAGINDGGVVVGGKFGSGCLLV